MKRKHKLYSRPKKPYDKKRIEEEAVIIEKLVLQKYIGNGVTSIVINIHLNIGKYVVCLDNKIINSSWKQLKTNIILFVQ